MSRYGSNVPCLGRWPRDGEKSDTRLLYWAPALAAVPFIYYRLSLFRYTGNF